LKDGLHVILLREESRQRKFDAAREREERTQRRQKRRLAGSICPRLGRERLAIAQRPMRSSWCEGENRRFSERRFADRRLRKN
jgi:hypothetical protein